MTTIKFAFTDRELPPSVYFTQMGDEVLDDLQLFQTQLAHSKQEVAVLTSLICDLMDIVYGYATVYRVILHGAQNRVPPIEFGADSVISPIEFDHKGTNVSRVGYDDFVPDRPIYLVFNPKMRLQLSYECRMWDIWYRLSLFDITARESDRSIVLGKPNLWVSDYTHIPREHGNSLSIAYLELTRVSRRLSDAKTPHPEPTCPAFHYQLYNSATDTHTATITADVVKLRAIIIISGVRYRVTGISKRIVSRSIAFRTSRLMPLGRPGTPYQWTFSPSQPVLTTTNTSD